jgi:hypothetical protein
MPAALLKLDENIPDLVAEILGAAGHDVALARDEQLSGVEDETLLGAAITEARALVTFDLHFSDIRRHDPSGTPGIRRRHALESRLRGVWEDDLFFAAGDLGEGGAIIDTPCRPKGSPR